LKGIGISRLIKIAGAGPSGLSAAINLAKAGFDVEVFESGGDCGHRFGGDLQGLENTSDKEDVLDELKRMNIGINFDFTAFTEIVIIGDKKKCVLKDKMPIYIVKRGSVKGSLDQGLKKQAVDNGVKIHFNSTVSKDDVDIIATGPAGKEAFAVDTGIVFETDMKDIAVGLINTRANVKAYAYFIVTNGYGCICTMLADKFQRLNQCFEEAKKIFTGHYKFEIRNPRKVGGVGTFSTKDNFEIGGKYLVGEAAGIQDVFGGFGIRDSIRSGYMAARCMIEHKSYQQEAKNYFGPMRKPTVVKRFLYEMMSHNRIYDVIIGQLDKNNGIFNKLNNDMRGRRYGLLSKAIFPIALFYLRRRYKTI
jgi:flavin-dependent dehydrogenase